jgi:hypothetical protein
MTYSTEDKTRETLKQFRSFDVDTQLALLWFGYLDIKDQLNPANANSSATTATAVFDQIQALPKEEQLQAQRDIVGRVDSPISRAYGALDSSAKLELWLRLAQAMETSNVIQVPSDYKLPSETNEFVNSVTDLDFEERLNFLRPLVSDLGVK